MKYNLHKDKGIKLRDNIIIVLRPLSVISYLYQEVNVLITWQLVNLVLSVISYLRQEVSVLITWQLVNLVLSVISYVNQE